MILWSSFFLCCCRTAEGSRKTASADKLFGQQQGNKWQQQQFQVKRMITHGFMFKRHIGNMACRFFQSILKFSDSWDFNCTNCKSDNKCKNTCFCCAFTCGQQRDYAEWIVGASLAKDMMSCAFVREEIIYLQEEKNLPITVKGSFFFPCQKYTKDNPPKSYIWLLHFQDFI